MKPPGNDRLNILGDKTAEFYLNPKSFVESRVAKHKSSVFQQRFLNKPTIWLTDYNMVNSLLHEKCQSYDQGYDVMNILPQLFGSSCVLFQNSEIVLKLREILARSISGQVEKVNSLLQSKTKPALDAMCKTGLAQDLYQTLKEILTKLFLEFFFDIDSVKEPELIRTITELSIEHWHGITSIPTNLKLVGHTFQKALSAKKKLTQIFHERLQRPGSTPPTVYTELSSINEQTAVDHVLVCISALLPKAMASIVTSTLIQIAIHRPFERCDLSLVCGTETPSPAAGDGTMDASGDHNSAASSYHSHFMDAVIKETFRLYPPFFGGRKVATTDFNLCNYQIEAQQALIYMSYFAHRDPKVFPYPEEFLPERWLDGSCGGKKAKPNLFTFGGGPRECVGTHFTQHVIREILTHILRRYDVSITEPASYYTEYKWLPVSRPLKPVKLKFTPTS